jgi:CrcB protein
MTNIATILAVASGGAIGAVSRMLINGIVSRHIPHTLPFGTLTVNLIGSLLIGILFAWFHLNTALSPHLKSFLITGTLGALTTYSTFAIESFFLLQSGHYLHAFTNMALNLFGTIAMAGIGFLSVLHLGKMH